MELESRVRVIFHHSHEIEFEFLKMPGKRFPSNVPPVVPPRSLGKNQSENDAKNIVSTLIFLVAVVSAEKILCTPLEGVPQSLCV